MSRKLCWDLECDGLDPSTVWVLVAVDLDTGEQLVYSDHDPELPGIEEALVELDKATLHVGHNILAFDMWVLNKLYGWEVPEGTKVHDTLIMSRLNSYKRPTKGGAHGMAAWGEYLGNDKIDFNDWEKYSHEMRDYCIQDCLVNIDIYNHLMDEVKKIVKHKPNYLKALQLEMDFAKIDLRIKCKGWKFDMERAEEYLAAMQQQMDEISARVEPNLPEIKMWIDKEPKMPKFTKSGNYHATTAKALSHVLGREVFPSDALAEDPPWNPSEPYQRFEMVKATLGNMDTVKEYLFTIGWEPDDWNMKKVGKFEWVKVSAKLTETSLEPLGQVGKDVGTFYSTRNRHSVLRGWIENVRGGRLRGSMTTIGTPTFRVRHQVLVNLPGVDSAWGKEMRSLLVAEDGYKVVGADSAGNQARALCHYIGDPEFTDVTINGDVHQRNADVLGCPRPVAKGFLYAFLFGAGDAKLGEVLTGKKDSKAGAKARAKFADSIPGLSKLKLKLDKAFNVTGAHGEPWFAGLDGRRVYVGSQHQCLNYLLQAAEGVTCKAAIVYADRKMREEGLDYYLTLFYHDEIAAVVREDQAERALEIMVEAFTEAPKEYGVMCMGGDGVIGESYADVH